MSKIYTQLRRLSGACIALGMISGCSNNEALIEEGHSGPEIEITSATVENRAIDLQYVTPEDGKYYFYYKLDNTVTKKKFTLANGVFSDMGKTGLEWTNPNLDKKYGFTLSNSTDIATTNLNDIVWGQIKPASTYQLDFTLSHKMAQAEINLKLPKGWTIQSVSLKNLKNSYTFSNENGEVSATGDSNQAFTISNNNGTYSTLLPPQKKADDSELYVTVHTDKGETKNYHRLLPYAMREEFSEGQWQDIPLEFRAGHILKLNATITNDEPDDIYFTYATLTDWKNIGTSTLPIRPVGIYTVKDLNEWAKAWNNNSQDEVRLNKYGSKTDSKWTFVLKANITVPDGTNITQLSNATSSNFYLDVAGGHSYTITGTTASNLGLNDTGLYKNEIFSNGTSSNP